MEITELVVSEYTIEVWAQKGTVYVGNISDIVVGGLSINWKLNDVESLDFNLDLVQFEKRCELLGLTPSQLLTPYVHDIRVRRNGDYIIGCQVVEANIDIPNDGNVTIQVRCTGFLNLFKDRYLTYPLWAEKELMPSYTPGSYADFPYSTPAYCADQLVSLSQQFPAPTGIVKNPTGDIDRDYWLAANGFIEQQVTYPHSGNGAIRINRSGTGWSTAGTRLYVPKGTSLKVDVWVRGQPGVPICFVQRPYVNMSNVTPAQYTGFGPISVNGSGAYANDAAASSLTGWPQTNPNGEYQLYSFTMVTNWDVTYLMIEQNRTNTGYAIWVDDLFVSYTSESGTRDFGVKVYNSYTEYSSPQHAVLKRNYQLQNVKDALLELSQIDEDPIEFYFTPNREFHVGYKNFVGTDKPNIDLCYPGNVDSMTISRSASNLYNSILNIGSGIGNERIEAQAISQSSALLYGLREAVTTNNNASEYSGLLEEAQGWLEDKVSPTNLPKIVIKDGSINPGNVQVGDRVNLYINNGDNYLATITGAYRVIEYQLQVGEENQESVTLTVEKT